MGGNVTNTRHMVRNCVAWKNKAAGFYSNHSTGGHTWYNNTALQNGTQYNMLTGATAGSVTLTGSMVHILKNNIGFPFKNANMENGVDSQFNTWDLNITPKTSDFLNITDPSVDGKGQAIEASSPAFGPRQADGSLPNIDFLKLAGGSQMIDKGTDVGLPFVGAKPDLGAYEYGATGGTPGTGGNTGVAGAPGTGGKSGSGGATGSAGAPGTGGRSGTGGTRIGGATGTAGNTAIGGAPETGGNTATGGGTGGNGAGGLVDTGGAVETGGGADTGGNVESGGATEAGGSAASGGESDTGGVVAGGTPTPGGTSGIAATGGATTATSATEASASGCSCRIVGARTTSYSGLALLGLVMVVLRVRRKRRYLAVTDTTGSGTLSL
jgi:MYXO-CTERM domain-containing protein